jgi:signal transduction histidine kinase
MVSADAIAKLGERYAALGLRAAALGAYQRAAAADPQSALPPRRLAEMALAAGDGKTARRQAELAARLAPSPSARLLTARALVASGELAAARFAFAAVLDAAGVDARTRCAAHLGRGEVAAEEGDAAGAVAQLLAALEELARAAGKADAIADDLRLADEIATRLVPLGARAQTEARLRDLDAAGGSLNRDLIRASLLGAAQAHGASDVTDAEIERVLEQALAREPASRPLRLRLALRLSRRRYRDIKAKTRAIAILEDLAAELGADCDGEADPERSRVQLLLAGLYEDDPALRGASEEAYRAALRLRPRHAPAANNLAILALGQRDLPSAHLEIVRALRLDPEYDVAWRNAARLLHAASPEASFVADVADWLDAANPGAGKVAGAEAARLARAAADCATQSVLEAVYAKGHRLKNLLGIAGARVRAARKMCPDADAEVTSRLEELERELGGLYAEWAAYLRSLQAEGPRLEIVPVNPLVAEVVAAATQEGRPPLRFVPGAAVPDLRGDRALLREALLNLVVNALDAQEAAGERERPIEIATRATLSAAGAPVIEIEIRDRGTGIERADIARIFAPGFTTKPQGSGLGLAVAHRVVAAHHGRILVDSDPGHGTAVTVILPSDLGGFSALALAEGSRAEP